MQRPVLRPSIFVAITTSLPLRACPCVALLWPSEARKTRSGWSGWVTVNTTHPSQRCKSGTKPPDPHNSRLFGVRQPRCSIFVTAGHRSYRRRAISPPNKTVQGARRAPSVQRAAKGGCMLPANTCSKHAGANSRSEQQWPHVSVPLALVPALWPLAAAAAAAAARCG